MEIYWILNELSIMFPSTMTMLKGRGRRESLLNVLVEYENPHLLHKLVFNLMLEQRVNRMWLDYSLIYVEGEEMETGLGRLLSWMFGLDEQMKIEVSCEWLCWHEKDVLKKLIFQLWTAVTF